MGPELQPVHRTPKRGSVPPALLLATLALATLAWISALAAPCATAQSPALPDAPKPQNFIARTQPRANPCQVHNLGATMAAVASLRAAQVAGPHTANSLPVDTPAVV